jgi:hypothetical protein
MSRTALLNSAGALATLCVLTVSGPAVGETYVTFNVNNNATSVTAINSGGAVTGYDCDDVSCSGFVRAADGTITSFDPTGSILTYPFDINRKGSITGYFCDSSDPCSAQGFVRKPEGKISTIAAPNGYTNIAPTAINNNGLIAGSVEDNGAGHTHGFLRSRDGTITTFDPTGSLLTIPTTINANGDVAGYYADSVRKIHGFLRTADGTITNFDCKKSSDTWAFGISGKDAIAGECANDTATTGFERTPGGKIKIFAVQGASATYPHGMNAKGAITGEYSDSGNAIHGFVGSPKSGFTSFDVPRGNRTEPSSINDGGVVAGSYTSGGSINGFIRTP